MTSRVRSAAIGLLSAAAALAAGHLAAALGDPRTSPPVAVGGAVIDLAPSWLKDFAVAVFGQADKLALIIGMLLVIAALAVVAGLLSQRRWWPGALVIAAFGIAGIVAAAARPDGGIAPALVSLVIGVGAFALLWFAGRGGGEETSLPPASDGWARRRFLVTSGLVLAGSGVAAAGGSALSRVSGVAASRSGVAERLPRLSRPAIPAGADFAASGTPRFLTSNRDFYRIDTALVVPRLRAEDWRLRLHGMVDRELDLSFDELLARRAQSRTITLTCVSNPVGGDLISTADFAGVPVRDLLLEAGIRAGAQQLLTRSSDGYTAGTPLDVLLEPDRGALLAFEMNGEPLPPEHGFPVRMVVPGLYGYVSATKWLVSGEVTTFDRQHYWEQRGWARYAPIKTQSRIDRPRPNSSVPAGAVTVAGIAWAQHTGIRAVEVSVDDGPWQAAELATDVSRDTWRMWRARLDLPPGDHRVRCRAIDRTGTPQTAATQGTVPDGATGLHAVPFRCV
ncbi:molybdopterin-dependent oxidoreductase [Saccharopolyspora griseoalba]|uniref:Molybdopterin-dependent oxidoreductase n=1 Tax=Saccharopolyspora griseoalba TaxID=1431848 RepID=A0ABW2LEA4_9PSEU